MNSPIQNIDLIIRFSFRSDGTLIIPVKIDGTTYTIQGTSTRIVDVATPCIELLTPESTPQKKLLRGEAVWEFCDAIKSLVTEGTKFVTVLRGTWNLPALSWEVISETSGHITTAVVKQKTDGSVVCPDCGIRFDRTQDTLHACFGY
ncbi:MAG: hypothetical protein Q7S72_00675 [Candidatus Taylorbacteria bacterium]|nr:hypothetical protein [Candidatus Taylorbacteria bacterium]